MSTEAAAAAPRDLAGFFMRPDEAGERAGGLVAGAAPSLAQQYLVVSIDQERYGVPIAHVAEIVRERPITPVPRTPTFLRGIAMLRGAVIPVLDLGLLLGLVPHQRDASERIVVLKHELGQVGMLVRRVTGVRRVPEDTVQAPPRSHTGGSYDLVAGVSGAGDDMLILLDVQSVLAVLERAW